MKAILTMLGVCALAAGCATESAYTNDAARAHKSGLAGYDSRYDGVPGHVSPSNSPRGTWREPSDSSDKTSRKQMP